MFKAKNDGRYRLEFYFVNGGVGWLVNNDKAQIEAWWDLFSKPLYEENDPDRIVCMALFIDGHYIKEHRQEHLPVAA